MGAPMAAAPNGKCAPASKEEDFYGTMAPLDQPRWVQRFFKYLPGWRVNLLSFYSRVVFRVIVAVVIDTGFEKVLAGPVNNALTVITAAIAWVFGAKGAFRSIKDAGDVPLVTCTVSMINNTDPNFQPLYGQESSRSFPETEFVSDGYGFNEHNCHFLALCMKVAYEDVAIIKDVVTKDWGWTFETAIFTLEKQIPKLKDTKYVPETRAFVISNANAVVLVFRGTEPLNLVEWFSDGDADMERRPNAYGYVHTGFYEAFFYSRKRPSIFQRIVEELSLPKYKGKKLFVTGHSLGGALVTVFAHALAKRAGITTKLTLDDAYSLLKTPIGKYHGRAPLELGLFHAIVQGGGVYTFAGPRAGNLTFAAYNGNCYEGRTFRIVHSADLVPKVPPIDLAFRHHPKEYFLTTFGYLLEDPEDIEKWRAREVTGLNFVVLYWYKILAGFFHFRENFLRTLERIVFFFLAPGFTDHWPCDYERKLRNVALNLKHSGEGVINASKPANAARRRPKIVMDSTAMHLVAPEA